MRGSTDYCIPCLNLAGLASPLPELSCYPARPTSPEIEEPNTATVTLTAPMFDVWKVTGWSKAAAIPARHLLICWKHDLRRGVVDVLVTPFPDDRQYFHDYWDGTSGACYSDWLQPGKNTMTPENVFGELAASIGFATKEAAEKAIVMFSRIEQCAWAMLESDSYDRLRKADLTEHW